MMKESPRAKAAWCAYLEMGESRSLRALADIYQSADNPPTRRLETLADWSIAFRWQERLQKLSDQAVADTERELAERRHEAMTSGLANEFERVRVLNALAAMNLRDLQLWIDDIKISASGKVVTGKKYNREQLSELRGLLSDLAAETGGRGKRMDITSAGEALKVLIGLDPDLL